MFFFCFCRLCSHFQNDALGCNAVSWGPAQAIGSQTPDGTAHRRLVTGACDNSTRIWKFHDTDGSWKEEVIKGLGHTGMYYFFTLIHLMSVD